MVEFAHIIEWAMGCVVILGAVIVICTRSTRGLRDLAAMIAVILQALGALIARRPAVQ